jgi:hypothetical protein
VKNFTRLVWCSSVALVGCRTPTPGEQLDGVRSWLATADMAAQAWVNHTTPEKYTRQTLELAQQSVEQIAAELLQSPPSGVDSASLDSLLTRSTRRIDRMARLVTSRNSPEVRIDLDSLRIEENAVHEIAERLKSAQ